MAPSGVRIVQTKGQSALVEWQEEGRLFRGYLPVNLVKDGTAEGADLAKAAPYGVPWERYINLAGLTVQALADELRRNGIWTVDDLMKRDRDIIGIATNLVGRAVFEAAKKANGGNKDG